MLVAGHVRYMSLTHAGGGEVRSPVFEICHKSNNPQPLASRHPDIHGLAATFQDVTHATALTGSCKEARSVRGTQGSNSERQLTTRASAHWTSGMMTRQLSTSSGQ